MDAESLILRGINIFLHGLTNATLTRGIANLFAAIKTLLLTADIRVASPKSKLSTHICQFVSIVQ